MVYGKYNQRIIEFLSWLALFGECKMVAVTVFGTLVS